MCIRDRLQDLSIDSYLIDKGEYRNAVSLGVFTRRPFAEALLTRVSKRGFEAKISPLERQRTGYQVRAELAADLYQTLLDEENPLRDCRSTGST